MSRTLARVVASLSDAGVVFVKADLPDIAALNAAAMAFISVAVSAAFVSMSDGSCDRNTAQPKLIATNISRDVIVRSSRSLKRSSSCCLSFCPTKASTPATGSPVSTPAATSIACLAASSGCRLFATGRQSCARQRAIVE